jgi:DNA repair protein RadA/Sms
VFRCGACGAVVHRWVGRCPSCGGWATFDEVVEDGTEAEPASDRRGGWMPLGASAAHPAPLSQISVGEHERLSSGLVELDRVLGGGLVPGSVTLLAGEPGIGKSTLVLQVLSAAARLGGSRPALLVSAEESAAQVARRARRLGADADGVLVLEGTDLAHGLAEAEACSPSIVALDSVQTVLHPDIPSPAGSLPQVRHAASEAIRLARTRAVPVVLIGHVTKEGVIAGPRALEHAVDTVVAFEGDRYGALRTLRALKHRFGTAGEVGVVEMGPAGLVDVEDPSRLALGDRRPGLPGSVLYAGIDGRRPVVVEVQALVAPAGAGGARRVVQGLDASRVAMVLAVLGRHRGLRLADADVFCAVTGGLRAAEAGVDLAVAVAVASAVIGRPVEADVAVCGELGLGAEVRRIAQLDGRVREAERIGLRRVVGPAPTGADPGGTLVEVDSLGAALAAVGLLAPAVAA